MNDFDLLLLLPPLTPSSPRFFVSSDLRRDMPPPSPVLLR
jgi:hypothetical protein